ncbi:hypothetical protein HRG_015115 [Hirsutella rhossiliensis]
MTATGDQSVPREERVLLAVRAYQQGQFKSTRKAAAAYDPGNREWVTVIESINCQGWALPAKVIFQGKLHQASWYESGVPDDWHIAVSENGWTSDDLALNCKTEYDWCLDWKQMSRSCGSRKWTKEEMMAYLDWDKAEEERLDARVAEEMQAQPFSRERGTAGIWADCERDSEEQQANYSRI